MADPRKLPSTASRPLWVIAFAMVTIAICLIALVLRPLIQGNPISENQLVDAAPEESSVEAPQKPKPKPPGPTPRILHSVVSERAEPAPPDASTVVAVATVETPLFPPSTPAAMPSGGFVPRNGRRKR